MLSTHKSSDGDGLGSEIAMYHALKKLGKSAFFIHSDKIPARYHFLIADISPADFKGQLDPSQQKVDLRWTPRLRRPTTLA